MTTIAAGERRARRLPLTLIYAALIVAAALTMLPFVWVLSGSLRSMSDFQSDPGAWLPSAVTFENYGRLFSTAGFGGYLANSLIVAAMVVGANVIGGALAGYALGKLRFRAVWG